MKITFYDFLTIIKPQYKDCPESDLIADSIGDYKFPREGVNKDEIYRYLMWERNVCDEVF